MTVLPADKPFVVQKTVIYANRVFYRVSGQWYYQTLTSGYLQPQEFGYRLAEKDEQAILQELFVDMAVASSIPPYEYTRTSASYRYDEGGTLGKRDE